MASREPGGYAFTPPLGGRDFHPHRDISYQGSFLVSYPPDRAGFRRTHRTAGYVRKRSPRLEMTVYQWFLGVLLNSLQRREMHRPSHDLLERQGFGQHIEDVIAVALDFAGEVRTETSEQFCRHWEALIADSLDRL